MTARAATSFDGLWFGDETPRDFARWALAAALVAMVHAALLGGYLFWRAPDDVIGDIDDNISIELDPIDSTADAKLNLAPAPEEMIEQKATPVAPEKPPEPQKVTPPPPPDPDLTTTDVPPPEVKPPEKVEEPKAPAPVTAAPTRGGAPHVERSWETLLMRKLQQLKRYPSGAQARGEQGVAMLAFSVDRDGRVLDRKIVRSSGHPDLDNEALAMIERAEPLPAFPRSMTQAQQSLTVPIRFSLR
ncbi:MAG TPA: energy transducer TonB [Pseudolabrys sp.]|jgi:protein TonB